MLDQVADSFRPGAHNGCTRRESFDDRYRHVIHSGCVNKDVSTVIISGDVLSGRNTGKLDIRELQFTHQAANLLLCLPTTDQVEPRLGIFPLYLGEGPHHDVQPVVRMKPASAHQMRPQRTPQPKREPRKVRDIGHDLRVQTESFEYVDQVSRWHDQRIRPAKKKCARTESAQVIFGFATVVVDQRLLTPKASD